MLSKKIETEGLPNIMILPQNFSWAMEMHVVDPDGHVLRFDTDPDPDKLFVDQQ